MPLIRNQFAGHVTPRAVALRLDDIRSDAEAVLASARTEAEAVIARARQEAEANRAAIAEAARAKGEAEGYAQGMERGRATGHAEALTQAIEPHKALFDLLAPAWMQGVEAFTARRDAMLEDAQRGLLELAVDLTQRLTLRQLEFDPSIVCDQVARALELIGSTVKLRLVIAPSDREAIERALPGLLKAANISEAIELIEDDTMTAGGCLLTSIDAAVDAQIETQLERMSKALLPGDDT